MPERASETILAHKLAPSSFRYTITLKDTGTTPIGTFWFAWVPGEDFLPKTPHAAAPAGWTEKVLGGSLYDGFSIQWLAKSAATALRPGQSKTFVFTSAATPTQVFGHSTLFPPTRVSTSFVYSGAPFSDAGYEFSARSTKTAAETHPALAALAASALGGATDAFQATPERAGPSPFDLAAALSNGRGAFG